MNDGMERHTLKTLLWIFMTDRRMRLGWRVEGNSDNTAHKL